MVTRRPCDGVLHTRRNEMCGRRGEQYAHLGCASGSGQSLARCTVCTDVQSLASSDARRKWVPAKQRIKAVPLSLAPSSPTPPPILSPKSCGSTSSKRPVGLDGTTSPCIASFKRDYAPTCMVALSKRFTAWTQVKRVSYFYYHLQRVFKNLHIF